MEKVEVFEVVKVTEEVESFYSQIKMTTPKKRKNKGHEDSVEKSKKPRSAFLLYFFDVHQIMQQEIPNLPQSEINKRISESWKRLSVAEKGYYLEKAKSEKEGIDTSSPSPSKDLPGFRKILPRGSYFLLSKGGSSNQQLGSQAEVSAGSLDPHVEGTLTQEPQPTPLVLAGEVELCEQAIVVDNIAEETEVSSNPSDTRGIPPSSSSSVSCKALASTDEHVSQVSAGLSANGVTLKGNETTVAASGYSGAMVQQVQGETTPMVAIIPFQNLLEPKSLPSVGSVGPVNRDPSANPCYKMSLKTYTRRGRGRCLNPGCSFVYVTRHKPPTCPECGSHLGGKWIPPVKKTQAKEAASRQLQPRARTKTNASCPPTPSPAQEGNADLGKTNSTGSKRGRQVKRCSRKQSAVPAVRPAEGSSTKEQEQTKQMKEGLQGATVQGHNRSSAPVQKRPVRPILPAFCNTGQALFQIMAVPSDKESANNNKSSSGPQEGFSGLKPSTLKQLGQTVLTTAAKQDSSVPADGSQPMCSLVDGRMNFLSFLPFKHSVSNLDLGLSTSRGRGRCKNPSCDYMYKNRHKPAVCPKCGCELTQKNAKGAKSESLLDPYQALSPAQRDVQRQNTLQLLHRSLQIPESETELQETLNLIQELNSLQIVLVQPSVQEHEGSAETETLVESGWPQFYESEATHCGLCHYPLFKGGQSTVAGQEDCLLLTETLIQTVTLQLKVCLNVQCLALHSFTDLHPGLFNVGNRLLVSIDLFLKIRDLIKLGQPPPQAARTLLDHNPNHPVHSLSAEEFSQILEFLLSGYWAFESLTVRDYNDMICGICGVAPKLEIAQRHTTNVLELKNVEFTWPECSVSDEVHVDDFWLTMESEAIEQATFPTDIPITRVDASIIAPFIPPLMRSPTVINTEKDKVLPDTQQPSGDPSALDELLASLISLYTLVQSGLSTAPQPPPPHLTAGKLSKLCPHKVVCGSKCLVRGETARDHVDLLLSSRFWPPVYVSDCARQVALCADMQYPEQATQMWGRNQGCFSDPFEKPEFVSCAELQEQPYSADLSLAAENQQVHPITKSSCCWLVHPPGAALPSEHHSMSLCRDLEPYAAYYYLYNRLVDFLTSRDIVSEQINQVVKACQPGEVVIRDALYRLGVAQIDTEKEEDEGIGVEVQTQEEGTETCEVVLNE
ncbi:HMG domain containing protein 3 [Dissostichus eleginoides]|uniref:HMG domain containing protein 3 n=1 Tax=Dissostichus eleginoides TaxID=100907 RepID=A0AAD9CM25_DISEL|nr:HMG domain containing protein 3 [Dissostichus eleginoides]